MAQCYVKVEYMDIRLHLCVSIPHAIALYVTLMEPFTGGAFLLHIAYTQLTLYLSLIHI